MFEGLWIEQIPEIGAPGVGDLVDWDAQRYRASSKHMVLPFDSASPLSSSVKNWASHNKLENRHQAVGNYVEVWKLSYADTIKPTQPKFGLFDSEDGISRAIWAIFKSGAYDTEYLRGEHWQVNVGLSCPHQYKHLLTHLRFNTYSLAVYLQTW